MLSSIRGRRAAEYCRRDYNLQLSGGNMGRKRGVPDYRNELKSEAVQGYAECMNVLYMRRLILLRAPFH